MKKIALVSYKKETEYKQSNLIDFFKGKNFDYDEELGGFTNHDCQIKLFWIHELSQPMEEYKGGHLRKEYIKRILNKVMPKIVSFLKEEKDSYVIFNGYKTSEYLFQILLDRVNLFEVDKQLSVREDLSDFLKDIDGKIGDGKMFELSKLLEGDVMHTIFYKYKVKWFDTEFWIMPNTQPRGKQTLDMEPWHNFFDNYIL